MRGRSETSSRSEACTRRRGAARQIERQHFKLHIVLQEEISFFHVLSLSRRRENPVRVRLRRVLSSKAGKTPVKQLELAVSSAPDLKPRSRCCRVLRSNCYARPRFVRRAVPRARLGRGTPSPRAPRDDARRAIREERTIIFVFLISCSEKKSRFSSLSLRVSRLDRSRARSSRVGIGRAKKIYRGGRARKMSLLLHIYVTEVSHDFLTQSDSAK